MRDDPFGSVKPGVDQPPWGYVGGLVGDPQALYLGVASRRDPRRPPARRARRHRPPPVGWPPMTDDVDKPIAEQLAELGAQLAWVREYL